jgi:hypothetical protein
LKVSNNFSRMNLQIVWNRCYTHDF